MKFDGSAGGSEANDREKVGLACDSLARDGWLILDRLFAGDTIMALAHAVDDRLGALDDRLRVGERRFAAPIDLAGPFADPTVYANPAIVAVIRATLGPEAVLEWIGTAVTLAGASPQHIQRDSKPLFDSTMSPLLPAHALAVMLPLVSCSAALWPKSHRWKTRDENAAPVVLELAAGSCLVRDVRLFHGDTANPSAGRRTVLNLTYARPWYRDPGDVLRGVRAPPSPSGAFLSSLAEDHCRLFAHLDRADETASRVV
ncbi:hypothetical protein BH11PSE3_BH11PSE3_08100 [soil metagenome]